MWEKNTKKADVSLLSPKISKKNSLANKMRWKEHSFMQETNYTLMKIAVKFKS